jgi:DNA-binding transcriptional MerR regulator
MENLDKNEYYKISQLSNLTNISKYTIAFYDKKGLLPNTINTSKNMKYYPKISITVLNIIKYLKQRHNFSIDYIKELFDYFNIDFNNQTNLIIQSIEMISNDIKHPIKSKDLDKYGLKDAINYGLLDKKDIYFKKEVQILKIFHNLQQYSIAKDLIKAYIKQAKKLAILEKEVSNTVLKEHGGLPEVLVLDVLHLLKPFIFNTQTLDEFNKESK